MKQIEITLYGQNIWGNMSKTECISNRNGCIRDMIVAYDADICCFQECNPRTSRVGDTAIELLLQDVYEEVPTEVGKNNYTPVFYRRDRFNVVESGFTCYEGLNDSGSKSITWAVMEEKESGVRFGICSTHFWWKSTGEIDNAQRLENAAVLLEHIRDLENRYGIPVFATGDLNCGKNASQGEEPYLWLKERLWDIRDHAEETTDAFTHHAYPVRDEHNVYHAKLIPQKNILDHFFVTENADVQLHSFSVDNSAVSLTSSDHSPMIVKATVQEG